MMARILLIEPDVVLARTYAEALTHAGHQAVVAQTAQAAIHAADDHTPDLVVLELQLPAHNGIEFLYEFRSYPEWQAVPVIVNSYTPPQELAPLRETLATSLGVRALHYKPRTTLQLLLRSIAQHAPAGILP